MADRIIALGCPACGDARNEIANTHSFGAEFQCISCGVTSVLIINNQLHVRQPHEHICAHCGRIAPIGARFCQCLKSLVRECEVCRREIFVDDRVCPNCGWNSVEALGSFEIQRRLVLNLEPQLSAGANTFTEDLETLLRSVETSSKVAPEAVRFLKKTMLKFHDDPMIRKPTKTGDVGFGPSSMRVRLRDFGGVNSWYNEKVQLDRKSEVLKSEIQRFHEALLTGSDPEWFGEVMASGVKGGSLGFFAALVVRVGSCHAEQVKVFNLFEGLVTWLWNAAVVGVIAFFLTLVVMLIKHLYEHAALVAKKKKITRDLADVQRALELHIAI